MKKIFIFLSLLILTMNLFPQKQLIAKKIAKVGSEVILQKDIDKYIKLYKVTQEEAKKELVEESLLFQGAKLYTYPPEEKEIESQIRDDKTFYANKVGKDLNKITDQEFLSALLTNNVSMKTYREYVLKKMWIAKFISETYEKEKMKGYYPTEKEIESFIKEYPLLFEEKEGIVLSMIYFSYYTKDGTLKNDQQKTMQKNKAEECLKGLDIDEKFIEMVSIYSDDLVSLNTFPKGRVGIIRFDDPRAIKNLSDEILNSLKDNPIGIIKKIFETPNGLYIFKIDDKITAKKLSKEESILKAQSHLVKNYEDNLKEKTRAKLINELKSQIELIYY